MTLRLILLSNVQIKEQQEILKAYEISIKSMAKGRGGGYQSRITFNVKLNHASPRTFLSNHVSRK